MRKNKDKLFVKTVNAYLEEVRYNTKEIPKGEDLDLQIRQDINVLTCDKSLIALRMSRKAYIEGNPDAFLEVSAVGEFILTENTINNFQNLKELEEYVGEKAGVLIDKVQIGAVLSQIIANITGTFGNPPLILPAVLNEKTIK